MSDFHLNMSQYKTPQEFQDSLQVIRNKHYQLHQKKCYDEFINYYQEDIGILYDMILEYYNHVDYEQFKLFVYQTSI